MKTFYTLLLAFGLCLTVHSQSNINLLNYQNINSKDQSAINILLTNNQSRLLLQEGFSAKKIGDSNIEIQLIKVVNSNSIDDDVLENFAADYSQVEIIVFSNIDANSTTVSNLDLTGFSKLKYILVDTSESLTNTFVQNLLQNVKVSANIMVVYKQKVLM